MVCAKMTFANGENRRVQVAFVATFVTAANHLEVVRAVHLCLLVETDIRACAAVVAHAQRINAVTWE